MTAAGGTDSKQPGFASAADVDLSNIDKVHRFPGIRR